MTDRPTVVIVEDNVLIAEDLSFTCEESGATVVAMSHSADDALDIILAHCPTFVLMDVRLGGPRDGVHVALDVHEADIRSKVIFLTGSNEPPTLSRIRADHPYRILIKPVLPADLREALGL